MSERPYDAEANACACDGTPHRVGQRKSCASRPRLCQVCGPIPASEPLYNLGGEQFHAVITREARWGPEPEPSEAEPCGPVTGGSHDSP